MTTVFRTVVSELPPTPLGLLPARWHVGHQCTVCHSIVAAEDLIEHARGHESPAEGLQGAPGS